MPRKMKMIGIIGVLALITTPLANARLGDTEEQLIKRYGKPIAIKNFSGKAANNGWSKMLTFKENGIKIVIGIDGVLNISAVEGFYDISKEEALKIKASYGKGHSVQLKNKRAFIAFEFFWDRNVFIAALEEVPEWK